MRLSSDGVPSISADADASPYYHYDLDWIVTVPNMDPWIRPFETIAETREEVSVRTGFGAIMHKVFSLPMPEMRSWETDTFEKLQRAAFDPPGDPRRFFSGGDNQIAGVGDAISTSFDRASESVNRAIGRQHRVWVHFKLRGQVRERVPHAGGIEARDARAIGAHKPVLANLRDGRDPVVPQGRVGGGVIGAHRVAFEHRKPAQGSHQQASAARHLPLPSTDLAPANLRAASSEYPHGLQEDFSRTVHISHQLLPLLPGLRREQTAGRFPP